MKFALMVFCCLFITGCAGVPINKDLDAHRFSGDPEKLNRALYQFNDDMDTIILRPISQGYANVTPDPIKKGISNFFNNLLEINSLINNLLQGDVNGVGNNLARIMTNTAIGIFGLIDVASKIGVETDVEDFGQTMAVWGIPPGPYLVLPFLGPSSLRDAIGLIPYYLYTRPQTHIPEFEIRAALTTVNVINQRANFLGASALLEGQLDPYGFVRQIYEQTRINAVFDNNPPEEEFDDF